MSDSQYVIPSAVVPKEEADPPSPKGRVLESGVSLLSFAQR
jgi:hypothetical protein